MMDYERPRCERCIYRNHCPCGYSNSNAACLTLYVPQTREMLLECIQNCGSRTHAIDEIRDYVKGFSYYMTEPRMRASATEPCSVYQQNHVAECLCAVQNNDRPAFLHGLIQILDDQGSKRPDLTYAEFLLLYALLMAYNRSSEQKEM